MCMSLYADIQIVTERATQIDIATHIQVCINHLRVSWPSLQILSMFPKHKDSHLPHWQSAPSGTPAHSTTVQPAAHRGHAAQFHPWQWVLQAGFFGDTSGDGVWDTRCLSGTCAHERKQKQRKQLNSNSALKSLVCPVEKLWTESCPSVSCMEPNVFDSPSRLGHTMGLPWKGLTRGNAALQLQQIQRSLTLQTGSKFRGRSAWDTAMPPRARLFLENLDVIKGHLLH